VVSSSVSSSEKGIEKPASSLADAEISERAAALLERYSVLYSEHRNGAKWFSRGNLDWHEACRLVQVWDNARLEKLAVVFLTTNEQWIAGTDRSFKLFAVKASWCDDRLKQWELEHQVTA
jgi:hypothetical protein